MQGLRKTVSLNSFKNKGEIIRPGDSKKAKRVLEFKKKVRPETVHARKGRCYTLKKKRKKVKRNKTPLTPQFEKRNSSGGP